MSMSTTASALLLCSLSTHWTSICWELSGKEWCPKLFTAMADGVARALCCRDISFLHYVDDLISMPLLPPQPVEDTRRLSLCWACSLPVAPTTLEGSSMVLTFLGVEIDLVTQKLRLPQRKLPTTRIPSAIRMAPVLPPNMPGNPHWPYWYYKSAKPRRIRTILNFGTSWFHTLPVFLVEPQYNGHSIKQPPHYYSHLAKSQVMWFNTFAPL